MIEKGVRIANFIFDSILIIIIWALSLNIIVFFINDIYWLTNYYDLIFYLIYFFYYFLFEIFIYRTPGKMLTKTSVKTFNNQQPTFKMIAIRSVLRIVPIDQLSFLFGAIGLHDELSKTTVIKNQQ